MSGTITHNIHVHKANLSLMAGESVQAFSRAIGEAGKASLTTKLSLKDDDSAYLMDVYTAKVVFDVYDSKKKKYTYQMMEYKRDAKGVFSFGVPVAVKAKRDYVEVQKAASETAADGVFQGWVEDGTPVDEKTAKSAVNWDDVL